ncbi:MAG: methyltransferase [Chloroflexi bacterium]|nr:methyltransferase [Chloroflexota bacterium]
MNTKKVPLSKDYSVKIPENHAETLSQDQEYCVIADETSNRDHKLRLHEYGKIFSIPGLYELLYHEKLKCRSPERVCALLADAVADSPFDIDDLCVLDLGAGNGMVGEQLEKIGTRAIYGLDIRPEAKEAAERDRPGVYKDYYVADLTQHGEPLYKELGKKQLNCMTVVSALGFDDIPPQAFAAGFNLLSTPALVAFNIKDGFLSNNDPTGFAFLILRMINAGVLSIHSRVHYQHRLSAQGSPLYYFAIVGEKTADIPQKWVNADEPR